MAQPQINSVRHVANADEIVLGLLNVVEHDPSVTQRSVARELGIALGLTNAYLKRCIRMGLIKVGQVSARRYAYYVTPKGFAEKSRLTASYLAHSFSFFRRARLQCGELLEIAEARGQRRIVLIGNGDLAEITKLVAREHDVNVMCVIDASSDPERLAAAVKLLAGADAVVVTTIESSSAVYAAACAAFGVERVYAPELLRASIRTDWRLPKEARR